jgi:hydroxyacylglutathione hydrolase
MKRIADGVWQISLLPIPNAINAYVIGDVLIDAGTRQSGKKILKALSEHPISAHALTHAHPDHQGASHEICEKLGVPLHCGELDVPAMEIEGVISERQSSHPIPRLYNRIWTGPPHPVTRHLREGDEIAGFKVIETPGHSVGHISFFRESDRVAVIGDVLTNMDVLTTRTGLHEPKGYFTPDPARNRESARRIAELEPELVCFGHGPPLRDTRRLVAFVNGLAD